MIEVRDLSFGYADRELYNKISFSIGDGQHCVLTGSNGTGKTTLVEMIMDKEKYLYDGKIITKENCNIALMNQFERKDKNTAVTVMEYLSESFAELLDRQEKLCEQMAEADNPEDVFDEYQQVLDRFNSLDGDNYESNIKKELRLAGLEHCEKLELAQLSGGEYKLVQIIKEMMKNPDLFIMDEPDVFLDFDNLNGLVKLINSHKGTILVITHNRYLLNHCFDKVLQLENGFMQEYDGNFTAYRCEQLVNKVELYELAKKDIEEIERNRAVVDKLRAEATYIDNAAKGRQLKARVSYLARLEERQNKLPFIEAGCDDFEFKYAGNGEKAEASAESDAELSIEACVESDTELSIEACVESDTEAATNEVLIEVSGYSLSFENELLKDVSFAIKKGEKLAIVGENGTGKTTFLNDVYDAYEKKNNNAIRWSENVKVQYLSQLNMEEAERKLSGGEKNISCLRDIADTPSDILLLDEPTSHLDTYAQMSLERGLSEYSGAVLMVSHDFYSIVSCVDYVLLVEDNSFRKMSVRAFRKMIYDKYFDKDYILKESKKNELELMTESSIKAGNIDKARQYLDSLLKII